MELSKTYNNQSSTLNVMDNQKISNLPILKHFENSEIGQSVNSFRKGEHSLYNLVKIALFGAIGYFSWVYVLPPVFQAIGQAFAVASTLVVIIGLVIAAPVIFKGLRRFTRFLHKSVIKHDPFAELEEQRIKMANNKTKFQKAKGKISALRVDMEIEADNSEKNAKALESKILSLKDKAVALKTSTDLLVKNQGPSAKGTDQYVNDIANLRKVLSDADRKKYELQQQKDFISKYGTRAAIMKKFGQKLVLVETSMDIKLLDFDATIEILKKDYEFARKSREATDTAKSAMLFTEGWELEYALDVVTSTIAEDIAITAGNLNDIDSLTSTYSLDSDELYASLSLLGDEIKIGKDPIGIAANYSGEDYQLTHKDKLNSGGFDSLTERMF